MQKTLGILLSALLVLSVASCGKKGSLRTPTQMQSDAAKKTRNDEKTARKKAKEDQDNTDATTPEENAAPPVPGSSPQPPLQPTTNEQK